MFLLTLEEIKEFMANMSITLNLGVYRIFVYAYEVFLKLFSSRIIYNVEYREIINRIYTVIGVVMLFVIAISILSMIVDPEKNKGGKSIEKMISKIVVTIIIVILCPSIFNFGFQIQNEIYNGNYIYNIFRSKNFNKTTVQNAAAMASGDILGSFFYSEGGKNDKDIKAASKNSTSYILNGTTGVCDTSNTCDLATAKVIAHYGQFSVYKSFAKNLDLTDQSKLDFPWIIALIAGLYLVFIMVGFCFTLIMRIVKLAMYEIIAPIALCIGVIPSKEDITKSWAISVVKTYLSLFIHMFIVYLSVYLLSLISYSTGPFECTDKNPCTYGVTNFSYTIYALAIFTFMKAAPKLIDNLFGLNDTGSFSVKSIFKKGDNDKAMPITIKNNNEGTPGKSTIKAHNMYGKTTGASNANDNNKNALVGRARAAYGAAAQTAKLNSAGSSFSLLARSVGAQAGGKSKSTSSQSSTNLKSSEGKANGSQAVNYTGNSGARNNHNKGNMETLYSGTTSSSSTSHSSNQNISISGQAAASIQTRTSTSSTVSSSEASSKSSKAHSSNKMNSYSVNDVDSEPEDTEKKAKKINYEIYSQNSSQNSNTVTNEKTETQKNEAHTASTSSSEHKNSSNKTSNQKDENMFTVATTKKAQNVIENLMNNNTAPIEPDSLEVAPIPEKIKSQNISIKKYKTYVTKTLEGEVEIPVTPGIYCQLSDAFQDAKDKGTNEDIYVDISFEDDFENEIKLTLKYSKELLESEIDNYLDLV